MSENINLLRPAQAAEKLGIAISTLWARAKREPDFPKPVKHGSRTTCFIEHELDAYLKKRIAASRNATSA